MYLEEALQSDCLRLTLDESWDLVSTPTATGLRYSCTAQVYRENGLIENFSGTVFTTHSTNLVYIKSSLQ